MAVTLPVFFTYLHNLPAYSLLIIRALFGFVLTFLSTKRQQQVCWLRDSLVGVIFIVFGRLLPPLQVPYVDLEDKVAIVTGSNSGIGLQIASDLAERGATVFLACRNRSRAEKAIQSIVKRFPHVRDRVHFVELDTSSLASVKEFSASWVSSSGALNGNIVQRGRRTGQIDILVHNAGIAGPPDSQPFTSDGFESTYATNFLGPFLLTYLIQEHLALTARIVFTSSTAQYLATFSTTFELHKSKIKTNVFEPGFHCPLVQIGPFKIVRRSPFAIYSHTKAMQGAFARLLQQRFNRSKNNMRVVHYFTPDLTSTPILGGMDRLSIISDFAQWVLSRLKKLAISVEQGAATGSWLAVEQHDENVVNPQNGGAYWDQMFRLTSTPDLMDQELLNRLWTRWESDAGITWQ